MGTNVSSWKCGNDYIINNVMVKEAANLYRIPMFSVLGSRIQQLNFDIVSERNRFVEIGTNYEGTASPFEGGVFGRLKQVCTTECAVIRTKVSSEKLDLRPLCAEYSLDELRCNPDYGIQEDLETVLPEIINTSARQIERFGYLGYQGIPQLENITGLRGLLDISTAFTSPPILPIDSNDYQKLCELFTNGINQARKGSLEYGYEFLKSDISVHIASDIVDKINCSVLSNTTIGLYDKLLTGALSGIAGGAPVVTDQISNKIFFVNNRRIIGKYNYILEQADPYRYKMKTIYMFLLGTISFNPLSSTPPVVFADNVIDLS